MSPKTRPGRSRRRRRLDAGAGPSSSAGPGPKAPNGGMGDSASTGRAMLDILIEQLEWHWTNQLRPRLNGLTDEEYLWEPAAGALAPPDEVYAAWIDALRSLDDAALARPVGPTEGPWAEHSMGTPSAHFHREIIHHGAEVALLRDLWAHRGTL